MILFYVHFLISACADLVNRPEIKSLHFGGSLDARIGRTGFITAREAWGGDNRKRRNEDRDKRSGPLRHQGERGGNVKLQESPVRPEQASSKKVLSDLNRQTTRKSCQT